MVAKYKAGPAIRDKASTGRIMLEFTLGLCVVYLYSLINAYLTLGPAYAVNILTILAASLVTSVVCEAIYALITKKDVKEFLKNSYPWVTPMVIALVMPMNMKIYPVIASTLIGVFFGKLVYGGFGQNIFNPAGVARAVIFASFAANTNPDLVTGATPCASVNTVSWLPMAGDLPTLISDFGGVGGLLLQNFSSTIGEASSLVIILVCVYYVVRDVIDYRIPLSYVATIFIGATIAGAFNGLGLTYGLFHILSGGVLFGAIFMLTDPVTSPMTAPGKILFGIFAGMVCLLIRFLGNAPEGVLFSILIANMVTPLIDRIFAGKQTELIGKAYKFLAGALALVVLFTGLIGFSHEDKEYVSIHKPVFDHGETLTIKDEDYRRFNVKLVDSSTEGNLTTYKLDAKGYGLIDPEGHAQYATVEYKRNEFTIVVNNDTNTVESVSFDVFGDTPDIGDACVGEAFLEQFIGAGPDSSVDVVSGATWTSKSVMAAVFYALNGGKAYSVGSTETIGNPEDYAKFTGSEYTVSRNDDGSYHIDVRGYGLIDPEGHAQYATVTYTKNGFDIAVEDGKVASIVWTNFGDTPGVGDACLSDDYLASFVGKGIGDEVDLISGATWTSRSIVAAISAVLGGSH
jgi:electron transport complex protein RnfD